MNVTITSICSSYWPGKEPSLGDPDECEYFQVEHELCTSVVATSRSRTPRDCDKFLAVGSPDKDCQTRKTNARRRSSRMLCSRRQSPRGSQTGDQVWPSSRPHILDPELTDTRGNRLPCRGAL